MDELGERSLGQGFGYVVARFWSVLAHSDLDQLVRRKLRGCLCDHRVGDTLVADVKRRRELLTEHSEVAALLAGERTQPESDSIVRTSSAVRSIVSLAKSCLMCSGSDVPVSGSMPTANAKRKITCAGVARLRAAMPAMNGW